MKDKVLENQSNIYKQFNKIFTPKWVVLILLHVNKHGRLTKKELKQKLGIKSKQLDKKITHLLKHTLLKSFKKDTVYGIKVFYQLTNEGKFQVKNKILKDLRKYEEFKRSVRKGR